MEGVSDWECVCVCVCVCMWERERERERLGRRRREHTFSRSSSSTANRQQRRPPPLPDIPVQHRRHSILTNSVYKVIWSVMWLGMLITTHHNYFPSFQTWPWKDSPSKKYYSDTSLSLGHKIHVQNKANGRLGYCNKSVQYKRYFTVNNTFIISPI